MAVKLKVTYLDGREVVAVVSPRAQVETERHFGGTPESKQLELSYFLAWRSLFRSGQEGGDFDDFLDAIADIDEVKEGGVEDPTPAAASPTASSA